MSAPAPAELPAWQQVPAVPTRSSRRRDRFRKPLALAVGAVPPSLWMLRIDLWRRGLVVLAVGLVAGTVIAALGKRWDARLVPVAAAAIVVAAIAGPGLGVVAGASLVLADWAVRRRPPIPLLPEATPDALAPATVLALVAALNGNSVGELTGPLTSIALAFVVTLVDARLAGRLAESVRRAATLLGRLVVRVEFLVLAIFVVVLPWPVARLAGIDRFRSPHAPDSQWVPLGRRDPRPTQLWAPSGALLARPWTDWARRLVAYAAVFLVFFAVLNVVTATPPADEVPGVFADVDWWPAYKEELNWFSSVAFDPLSRPRLRDAKGTYVNVVDGVRRSWEPPDCGDCRRLEVWIYGGSTTFGLGQRDEHTIPSELARRAWRDGIVVDIVNRGVLGDEHWMEAQRFAWDVANEGAPDLVLFYDGCNEMEGVRTQQDLGRAGDDSPVDPPMELHRKIYFEEFGYVAGYEPDDGPGSAHVIAQPPVPPLGPVDLARTAAEYYEKARLSSRAVTAQYEIPVMYFWQPTLSSRPATEGEPPTDPDEGTWERRWWRAAPRFLESDVIDLSDLFDDVDFPTFYDDVHHDERGAAFIADALFTHAEPELRRLSGESGDH